MPARSTFSEHYLETSIFYSTNYSKYLVNFSSQNYNKTTQLTISQFTHQLINLYNPLFNLCLIFFGFLQITLHCCVISTGYKTNVF